jgi:hypothetical protein
MVQGRNSKDFSKMLLIFRFEILLVVSILLVSQVEDGLKDFPFDFLASRI